MCMCIYRYLHKYIHTYHIFFIHSSVSRHLGCFCILAIVHSAAINIGVCMYIFKLDFALDICLVMELKDHTVTLGLFF